MSSPSAVADLLAALAYRLQSGNVVLEEELQETSSSMGLAISELNRSLTLDMGGEDSGVRVLDAATSLMCFKAPQVFDSAIEYLVKTIVCVLSSSISFRVMKYHNEDTLQYMSSNLPGCSDELIQVSKEIIDKLGANGKLATMLFQAVVRSAASTSCSVIAPRKKSMDGRNRACVSKLVTCLPRVSSIENHEIPLRFDLLHCILVQAMILFWYEDPLSLKEDVSRILKYVCLHHFKTSVVGYTNGTSFLVAILSDAYFPFQCQFLRILAGPLTSKSLVMLAHTISKPITVPEQQRWNTNCKPTPMKFQALDDKTEWALAINFPDWFYFASAMLFSEGNSLEHIHRTNTSQVAGSRQGSDVEGISIAAATYLAWILYPVSGAIQESLTKSLISVSEICTRKSCGSEANRSETITGKRKKPDRLKVNVSSTVEDLVREFHKNITSSVSYELDSQKKLPSFISGLQNNLLVRRVVVGVLIGSPYSVADEQYEVVLHYAATGNILTIKKRRTSGFIQAKGTSKVSALLSNEITKEEAVEGTRLVFNLTDTLESMCVSSFEAEEDAEEFINRFKLKSSKYLVKCIDRLIQLHCEEDGDSILSDLNTRLLQWTLKGREDPQFNEDLDNIAAKLAFIFSPV
ncbi:unnamed protein product [Microthlaspi erraticum]|uniref:Uncharacterized protein n=1 Tax=Microthlaspi erraticum TaxID=1685480 RepID=A0A6D2KVU4_9BRAS|nr:unnamed protein product [Microthlaspi erraticum]